MPKRTQEESGEERVTAKSRPMMNLTARTPSFVSSSASSNPERTSYGYEDPGKSVSSDDRSVKPEEISWDALQKVDPHREEPLLGRNAHSARYGELIHDRTGKPDDTQANKNQKPNKKESKRERGDPCGDSEIPEWLQEFRENLVDDEIPLQGGSHASSSHEDTLEPTFKRRQDLGKHNLHTHFLKDRNFEICKRTKITRAPCRRRNGEAVPRADNFGDLITADHKVLSDNCESRNNHRYAVVVQDLATQWIQAYPCKKQNFTRNPEKLAKVPGTREETKSHLH